jgi:hypothetical protein
MNLQFLRENILSYLACDRDVCLSWDLSFWNPMASQGTWKLPASPRFTVASLLLSPQFYLLVVCIAYKVVSLALFGKMDHIGSTSAASDQCHSNHPYQTLLCSEYLCRFLVVVLLHSPCHLNSPSVWNFRGRCTICEGNFVGPAVLEQQKAYAE